MIQQFMQNDSTSKKSFLSTSPHISPNFLQNIYLDFQSTKQTIFLNYNIVIIMIKLNSIYQRLSFSTIRYPAQYQLAYKLNKQIRSCITIPSLSNYITQQDTNIKQQGKTIILQYLNEYPISFTHVTLKSPIQIYLYIQTLNDLNSYEEQLKYTNLAKVRDYAMLDAEILDKMLVEQQKVIIQKIQQQPYDMVDALNWLIMQRLIKYNPIVGHSLNVINNTPLQQSSTTFSRKINTILKRTQQLHWHYLREHTKLFNYICNIHNIDNQTPKQMISMLQKLVKLKLHVVGYGRVPKTIDQIYAKIMKNVSQFDASLLLIAFSCFQQLPLNYNPTAFNFLHKTIINQLKLNPDLMYIQMMPFSRLSNIQKQQIISQKYPKGITIVQTIFFLNNVKTQNLNETKLPKILQAQFMRPLKQQYKINNTILNGYINIASYLCKLQRNDENKIRIIVEKLKEVYKHHLKKEKERNFMKQASLCTICNFMQFQLQFGVVKYVFDFFKAFEEQVNNFTNNKYETKSKTKRHFFQIQQILNKYVNSKHPIFRKTIKQLINSEIQTSDPYKYQDLIQYIYSLQNSTNRQYYQDLLNSLYDVIRPEGCSSFAEAYLKLEKTNFAFNQIIIKKIWEKSHKFVAIGKIIAGTSLKYFRNQKQELTATVISILEESSILLNNDEINQFSIYELQKIIIFCQINHQKIINFSNKFFTIVLSSIQQNFDQLTKYAIVQFKQSLMSNLHILCLKVKGIKQQQQLNSINKISIKIKGNQNLNNWIKLREIESKFVNGQGIDNYQISAAVNSVIKALSTDQHVQKCQECMLLLLKLQEMEYIELQQQIINNFTGRIIKAIDQEKLQNNRIQQILGSKYPNKHNDQQKQIINKKRVKHITNILLHSASKSKSYDYAIFLLKVGSKLQNIELIQQTIQLLSTLTMTIKQVIQIIDLASNNINKLYSTHFNKILSSISINFNNLQLNCLNICFFFHYTNYQLPSQYAQLFNKMLTQSQKLLQNQINEIVLPDSAYKSNKRQFMINIYRYLWISIKINRITSGTIRIFKFVQKQIKVSNNNVLINQVYPHIGANFVGLMHICLAKESYNQPKQEKSEQINKQTVKKSFFLNRVKSETVKSEGWNQYKKDDKLSYFRLFTERLLAKSQKDIQPNITIQMLLASKGIKNTKQQQQLISPNYFELNYKINQINLSYFIKKQNKRYGIVLIQQQNTELKGYHQFLEQVYSKITGFTVIVTSPQNPNPIAQLTDL